VAKRNSTLRLRRCGPESAGGDRPSEGAAAPRREIASALSITLRHEPAFARAQRSGLIDEQGVEEDARVRIIDCGRSRSISFADGWGSGIVLDRRVGRVSGSCGAFEGPAAGTG